MSKWIESHQALAQHPKLFKLAALSGYPIDICIGKLHRLWWWALEYAEDGFLDQYTPSEIGFGIGINDTNDANMFYEALKSAKWIDTDNKLHDWLVYAGRYLKSKYHTANPLKYQEILNKWLGKPKGKPLGKAKTKTPKPLGDPPNLTLPNLTLPDITIPKQNIPDWLDLELWNSFKEMRQKKKNPMTEKAEELLIEKLTKLKNAGHDPSEVIKESIRSSWAGLFALKINTQTETNQERIERLMR